MSFDYAVPIKDVFPYIIMRDKTTGHEFYIDWNEKIADKLNEINV